MLKKRIKYKDFNGVEVEEIQYFHLGKIELMEMELFGEGGSFNAWMQNIIETEDRTALFTEFKKLILASFGQKSDDGRSFVKSEESRNAFAQTAAFEALFMELATETNMAVEFIRGVVPEDMSKDIPDNPEDMKKALEEAQSGKPKPPSPPARPGS